MAALGVVALSFAMHATTRRVSRDAWVRLFGCETRQNDTDTRALIVQCLFALVKSICVSTGAHVHFFRPTSTCVLEHTLFGFAGRRSGIHVALPSATSRDARPPPPARGDGRALLCHRTDDARVARRRRHVASDARHVEHCVIVELHTSIGYSQPLRASLASIASSVERTRCGWRRRRFECSSSPGMHCNGTGFVSSSPGLQPVAKAGQSSALARRSSCLRTASCRARAHREQRRKFRRLPEGGPSSREDERFGRRPGGIPQTTCS